MDFNQYCCYNQIVFLMGKKLNKGKSATNLTQKNITSRPRKLVSNRSLKILEQKDCLKPTIKNQHSAEFPRNEQLNGEKFEHLFDSQTGSSITQAEFDMMSHYSSKTKSFGVSILDEDGKFLFANKPANQLLQGCLNNFLKIPFINLIVKSQQKQIASLLKGKIESKLIKYCIYSKNIKRKHLQAISNSKVNYSDFLYFKYVKCLVSRVRPVLLNFKSYSDIDGFWNHQMAQKVFSSEPGKTLFLIETKIKTDFQNIESLNLTEDPVIKKFEHSQETKQIRKFLKDFSTTKNKEDDQDQDQDSDKKQIEFDEKQDDFINSGKRTLGKYSSTRSLRI